MVMFGLLNENEEYSYSFNEELEKHFTLREFSKGDHLFRQGEYCRYLYYIKKGIVRLYCYTENGKETTLWFSSENSLFTAIDCFYLNKSSRDYCVALEDLVVYTITQPQLELLLNDKNGAQTVVHILYETIRVMADHFNAIRFMSAEERYKDLIKKHPAAFQRISLGHIASYLGITQETLSRIRGKV